jgi:hypothetical protein
MKKLIKKIICVLIVGILMVTFMGCDLLDDGSYQDTLNTKNMADILQANQPTPTDIDYSLERYNIIRKTYWVNGQREKARTLPCPIADMPLGYVLLFSDNGAVIGRFIVEGKVTSLTNYLTPISEEYNGSYTEWLADIDGCYGDQQDGIFFFTPDGRYIEWTGTYLYSDIPFEIDDPVIKYEVGTGE